MAEPLRPAWAEVDLGAIAHNAQVLADLVAPAALCAVVKASAYGHGAVPVAEAALAGGASWLGVALVEEGRELRAAGITAPILLLSEPAADSFADVVAHDLVPTLYTFDGIEAAAKAVASSASESGRGGPLPAVGWDAAVLPELDRCKALVVGPGLGRSDATAASVRALVAAAPIPVVVDADGLNALGGPDHVAAVVNERHAATILTPHEGEFARLSGGAKAGEGQQRIDDVRRLAHRTGAIVLLKGSTTVVAAPGGEVLMAVSGSARLATAGTGDVLSGVVGAFLAQRIPPLPAAALAAHVHGRAASLGYSRGLVASDLHDLIARWLSR